MGMSYYSGSPIKKDPYYKAYSLIAANLMHPAVAAGTWADIERDSQLLEEVCSAIGNVGALWPKAERTTKAGSGRGKRQRRVAAMPLPVDLRRMNEKQS